MHGALHRLMHVGAVGLAGGGALVAWLSAVPPVATPEAAPRMQFRALVVVSYVVATLLVPYLLRLWCASPRRRCWPRGAYLAALAPPLMLLVGAAWVSRGGALAPGKDAVLLPGALLLLGYGLALAAVSDLLRLASAGSGQLGATLLGVSALASVFIGGPAVEHAPDEASRTRRITWLVQANPVVAASDRLPQHDPLRTPKLYVAEATPIGPSYMYSKPDWRGTLRLYALIAAICFAAASLLRIVILQVGVKPAAGTADNDAMGVTTRTES